LVGSEVATIEDVLTELDIYVDNGSISSTGTDRRAENHLRTFTNILNTARILIEAGDIARACTKLTDAQRCMHTGGELRTDHFITGSSADELYEQISELKEDLGCL
jgi:DNA polymerase III sliding clamp (beta) subunit (PCNA family)